MAEIVRMPKLSDTMTEGVVAEWHKNVGDNIESGELLAEIETDKATMEFESFQEGVLLHIGVEKGQAAPVGSILAIIGAKGEDITSIIEYERKVDLHAKKVLEDFQNSKRIEKSTTLSQNEAMQSHNPSSITEDTEYDSPLGDFFSGIFSILFWGIVIDLIIYFFFLPESERDSAWAMIEAIRDNQELGFMNKLIFYLLIALLPFIALWNYFFG